MTGLWTNDRDTLAGALHPNCEHCHAMADAAITEGAVRVLDPDDGELTEPLAEALHEADYESDGGLAEAAEVDQRHYRRLARVAVEALRQP